ncbi:hypothetical protein U1Q18_028683 [Sarracenia purpurea var. burkii]
MIRGISPRLHWRPPSCGSSLNSFTCYGRASVGGLLQLNGPATSSPTSSAFSPTMGFICIQEASVQKRVNLTKILDEVVVHADYVQSVRLIFFMLLCTHLVALNCPPIGECFRGPSLLRGNAL